MQLTVKGRGRQARRKLARATLLLGALGCALLLSAAAPALAGARARLSEGFRVQRVCRVAHKHAAACLGMKLIPASLTSAELHSNALTQSREAAKGARPAVTVKSPEPGFLTPQRLHEAYALPVETDASHVQTVAVVDAFD
ncbi:MAG TPA: hypothetical protein VGH21_00655, partial [Solirubrobacteraceae bacterium]